MKHRSLLFTLAMIAWPVIAHAQEKPTIAVIGTGNMGSAFGVRLAAAGYPIVYGSRDPGRAEVDVLVERTGSGASAATQRAAAGQADVVLLAVPWEAMEQVIENLGDLGSKVLIDIAGGPQAIAEDGYMQRTTEISGAEMIRSWAPDARVVKIGAPSQYIVEDPDILGTPPTVLIAADDRAAKETVARLLADIGLDPFDAGPLRFARSIDEMGLIFWTPLLQGRDQGIEFRLLRSSFWPCVWDVQAAFGAPPDTADLAEMPPASPPRPCEEFGR